MLFLIAAFIVYEAVQRLMAPHAVIGGTMLGVATAGLAVNVGVFFVLHGGDRENLNMRGAVLHVMGDLLGSVAAIVAALVILFTGWMPIDPILSVLVSMIILVSAWRLVRDAGHVLLEGAPAGLDASKIAPHLVGTVDGLREVHHVHAWSITPERRMATLHACVDQGADGPRITRSIKQALRENFSIGHATVEIEWEACADEEKIARSDAAAAPDKLAAGSGGSATGARGSRAAAAPHRH